MPLNPSVQLTLLYGDSPFLIERAAGELVDALLPGQARTYGLTVIDLETTPVSRVAVQLGSGSLMAEKRVAFLRGVDGLKAAEQSVLASLLDPVPPGVYAVLSFAASRQEINKAKGPPLAAKLRKLVETKGQSAAYTTPRERQLEDWAAGEAGRLGRRLDRAAAKRLVEMVGRDHARLFGELQKLCSYVGDTPQITAQDVSDAATRSAEVSVFDLVDAIAEGNARRALSILPGLLPSHNVQSTAIPLLGMIARQLRLVWQAGYLAQAGAPIGGRRRAEAEVVALLPEEQNVLVAARVGYVAEKLAQHARSLGDREIAVALQQVLRADRALKGQADEHMDPRLVMERLVTELCLLARHAARGGGAR